MSHSQPNELSCVDLMLKTIEELLQSHYEETRPLVIGFKAFLDRVSLDIDPLESELTDILSELSDGIDRLGLEPSRLAHAADFKANC